MLLSQAARTGRKFRRASDPKVWYWLEGKEIYRSEGSSKHVYSLNAEEITANNWEPEPLELTLSASDIMRAAREHDQLATHRRLSATEFAKLICQSLGLLEEE